MEAAGRYNITNHHLLGFLLCLVLLLRLLLLEGLQAALLLGEDNLLLDEEWDGVWEGRGHGDQGGLRLEPSLVRRVAHLSHRAVVLLVPGGRRERTRGSV